MQKSQLEIVAEKLFLIRPAFGFLGLVLFVMIILMFVFQFNIDHPDHPPQRVKSVSK